jgi:hypothetical protein
MLPALKVKFIACTEGYYACPWCPISGTAAVAASLFAPAKNTLIDFHDQRD